ncbi:hypothetical protein FALBO_40 [Fusarium albosuccineum]|uniref:Uncharacterized protein n=1 Tax=Fusarium albosuccineum TaxID=1237068 RepID=A0A8H4LP78_9HYPO|nr:hypothetical protein FALBO_40 [Fusarium albosuccineum]
MSFAVTQSRPQRELDAPKLDTRLAQRTSQHSQSRTQIESLSVEPPIYSPSADADESSPDTTPTTMMPTPRKISAEGAPALPAKSSLRASRCLDGLLPHKLAPEGQAPFATQSAPHDVYLSSEEDASSSADDFSDFEFDSGSDESRSSSHRRGSREDTAKLVSVVYSGKPSMIHLPRRSFSPSSSEASSSRPSSRLSTLSRPPSRLRRTSTLPVLDRRMSLFTSSSGAILHPPRTSSMGTTRLEKQRPEFLSIDPFATKAEPESKDDQNERPKTPKTPTGVFKRTLSLVKKRSRPSLNTHHASQSRDNLALFTPTLHMEQVREESTAESDSQQSSAPTPILNKAPTYHEIMRSAQRRSSTVPMSPMSPMSEPASPMTPNSTRSRLRQGLAAAARRRSIKA